MMAIIKLITGDLLTVKESRQHIEEMITTSSDYINANIRHNITGWEDGVEINRTEFEEAKIQKRHIVYFS